MSALICILAAIAGQQNPGTVNSVESNITEEAPVSRAQTIAIPGTRATLPHPPGFDLAEDFSGLACESIGASIMVTEMPAPIDAIREVFKSAEGLATQGMTLIDSEEIQVGDLPAVLVHARQAVGQEEELVFEKWMVVTGTVELSVLVTAAYPESIAENISRAMESTVRALQWDPNAEYDMLAGLPYRVEVPVPLAVAGRMSSGLLISLDGQLHDKPNPDPKLIVAVSLWDLAIEKEQLRDFAIARMDQYPNLEGIDIVTAEETTIDGMPAIEIVASAFDTKLNADMIVYTAMAIDPDRYYLLTGFATPTDAESFVPLFESVTASLERATKTGIQTTFVKDSIDDNE